MMETTRTEIELRTPPTSYSVADPAAQPIVASKRNPVHPDDVHFSRRWMALAASGAAVGLGGIARFGWRAVFAEGVLGAGLLAYMTLVEPRRPVLERIELRLPNLPAQLDGLRIGQISDSHLGVPGALRNLRWAINQMQREKPDLIAFTGDFVHGEGAMAQLPEALCGLSAPLGVYAVPGNHDYWSEFSELRETLANAGIAFLLNEHRHLQWNGADFWVLGTDDVWDGTPDLEAALRGVPIGAFSVLLAHTPHGAPSAARLGIDVQLSGHTHGGHMQLPFLGPIARPRYTDRFLAGLYQEGRMAVYVSRGIGGVPLRLLCRPEATILTLRRAA